MAEPHPLQSGLQVGGGRFTLMRQLGRGGMGVVWLAEDTTLGEWVALKFLPPEIAADPVALNELRRETARSHRLTHPNIIRIHDFHQDADGLSFISMEYVDGPTLSGLRLGLPQLVLRWDQLKPLMQQLCTALEYAHGESVIHRDLKPGNIMLDSKGRVKLADFGIAAVVSDTASRLSQKSSSGTLVYMSPQQLAGERAAVADDIYALGGTLYELLTSQLPFFTGDITHQVLHKMPEPVDERLKALGIQDDVPADVGALIMACLAKDPAQRPPSARAVAEWIGLEIVRKTSVEGLTQVIFPEGQAVPQQVGRNKESPEPADGAANGKKLALMASGIVAVLLIAGAAAWYFKLHYEAHPVSSESLAPFPHPNSNPIPFEAAQPTEVAPSSSMVVSERLRLGARIGQRWTNSLGMVFVSVLRMKVHFSIWDTRVRDFRAFAQDTAHNGGWDYQRGEQPYVMRSDGWKQRGWDYGWSNPGFPQTDDNPVTCVSWTDSKMFCQWLTEKERRAGLLATNQTYRMLGDMEWSIAAGSDEYPWGNQWPPPAGTGNYAGAEAANGDLPKDLQTIAGYNDGYARTSPVGSFAANGYGLYDMSGNVGQWCQNWYEKEMNSEEAREKLPRLNDDGGGKQYRLLRGAAWSDSDPVRFESAYRYRSAPGLRHDDIGFRCVLVTLNAQQ
jgi:serine/threonine protein kinase/formylglycine-generating enzyme required for sulfatase activity